MTSPDPQRLFVGSYTEVLPHAPHARGEGIYALDFFPNEGTLSAPRLTARATNPSFLAVHPDGQSLYAVSETDPGQLLAFRGQEDSRLRALNARSTEGGAPVSVGLDPQGRRVFAVNYAGGAAVIAFGLEEQGQLGEALASAQHHGHGPNARRQDGPHPHSLSVSPDGRHAYVMDLGTDEAVAYDLAPGRLLRRLHSAAFPPGSGPRHLAWHPGGAFAFVTLELGSGVAALRRDPATGELHLLGVTPAQPLTFAGENAPAEVMVSPDGRFVYVSNRGYDSVAVFAFDPVGGALSPVQYVPSGGNTPRGAALTPDAAHLLVANQDSSNIVVFRRDAPSGRLSALGVFPCPTPTSLAFVPAPGTPPVG